jgi:hypothetical protein
MQRECWVGRARYGQQKKLLPSFIYTQQQTVDGRGKCEWWLWSRRLTGSNATTSQGRQEQEASAQREAKKEAQTEAKTEAKTEAQLSTMTQRLLVAMTMSTTQNNNQPTTGASKFGDHLGRHRQK